MSDEPLRISVVCTANRFRSPVVAAALARLTFGLPVAVDSMASDGPGGQQAIGKVVALAAKRHDLDLSGHRSTAKAPGLLATSDLVICFEAHHVAAAIATAGAARERTLLALELMDMLPPLGSAPPEAIAARARDRVAAVGGGYRNIFEPRYQYADPMGGPRRRFRARVDELVEMTDALAARLVGADVP